MDYEDMYWPADLIMDLERLEKDFLEPSCGSTMHYAVGWQLLLQQTGRWLVGVEAEQVGQCIGRFGEGWGMSRWPR